MTGFVLFMIYEYLKYNQQELILAGITLVVGMAGVFMAWFNREKEDTKKDIDSKATKDELRLVDEKVNQHIKDNHESFSQFFDLLKETNATVKDILFTLNKKK